MLGFGLLFGGALLGVGTIAWPIYLHIRSKRNRQIQVVPSLRLFGFAKRQTRRIRLEQLLLMLARVLLLIALFALLSQPYWETNFDLPLPAVAGDVPDNMVLGMVVDDSLQSFHGHGENNRLTRTKAELEQVIERLPRSAQVCIATTTGEFATPPLSKDEATNFLKALRPIPQQGNATEALRNVRRALGGKQGCLLVAAPRNETLWQKLRPETDFSSSTRVHFLDTGNWTSPAIIQATDTTGDQPVIQLQGDAEVLRQTILEIRGKDNTVTIRKVTTHEALYGRVPLELPDDDSGWYRIGIADAPEHPWYTFYVSAEKQVTNAQQAIIFRNLDEASIVTDQILTAVIQSFESRIKIRHLEPAKARVVPQASLVVIVGNAYPPAGLQSWLSQQVQNGVRIVIIPVVGQKPGPAREMLPGWKTAMALPQEELPLKVNAAGALSGLDELLLLGIREIRPDGLIEPVFKDQPQAILSTRRDRLVLAMKQVSDQSSVWAFGTTFAVDYENSPAFHPAMPLLLNRVMFGARGGGSRAAELRVGDSANLTQWFGLPAIQGSLQQPDGSKLQVEASKRRPLLLPINQAGVHTLQSGGMTAVRLANFPRPKDPRTFTREQWAESRPKSPAAWHEKAFTIGLNDFSKLGHEAGDEQERRLDLSPVAFALLLGFLLFELVMLLIVWKRKGAVSV